MLLSGTALGIDGPLLVLDQSCGVCSGARHVGLVTEVEPKAIGAKSAPNALGPNWAQTVEIPSSCPPILYGLGFTAKLWVTRKCLAPLWHPLFV